MPPDASLPATQKSRPRAALSRMRRALPLAALPLLLAGCASGGVSPLGDALLAVLPGGEPDTERAEGIPYASLALDAGDRSGLVVMGARAGDTTLWPTGNRGLITLYRDGLQATAGLPQDLLETRYRPAAGAAMAEAPGRDAEADYVPWQGAAPADFSLSRSWQEADGGVTRLSARGRLDCHAPVPRDLPLASLPLQRCEQRLAWEDGSVTTGTLWRDPESYRLWAVKETPWPGGPVIDWEVARPWW